MRVIVLLLQTPNVSAMNPKNTELQAAPVYEASLKFLDVPFNFHGGGHDNERKKKVDNSIIMTNMITINNNPVCLR